ncbi:MAG TPA: hypothetical protein VMG62_07385, partial [Solirubrobacteraceae bacterium]|nr:hypothetical protein [Solirubrobacteraceae bacterium]
MLAAQAQGSVTAQSVAAGGEHTCAVLSSDRVHCWGENTQGELGNGTTESSDTPVEAQGVSNAVQVAAGREHTCALLSGGHIDCWGENSAGQLGNGTKGGNSDKPVEVKGISDATQVAAGYFHTCAVLSTGHVDCWGAGPLGNGTSESSDTPVEVQGIDNATQVTASYLH